MANASQSACPECGRTACHPTEWQPCPGPKPADYEWRGRIITHYVNHGGTWQGCDGGPIIEPHLRPGEADYCWACGGSGIGPTGDVSTTCPVCS